LSSFTWNTGRSRWPGAPETMLVHCCLLVTTGYVNDTPRDCLISYNLTTTVNTEIQQCDALSWLTTRRQWIQQPVISYVVLGTAASRLQRVAVNELAASRPWRCWHSVPSTVSSWSTLVMTMPRHCQITALYRDRRHSNHRRNLRSIDRHKYILITTLSLPGGHSVNSTDTLRRTPTIRLLICIHANCRLYHVQFVVPPSQRLVLSLYTVGRHDFENDSTSVPTDQQTDNSVYFICLYVYCSCIWPLVRAGWRVRSSVTSPSCHIFRYHAS